MPTFLYAFIMSFMLLCSTFLISPLAETAQANATVSAFNQDDTLQGSPDVRSSQLQPPNEPVSFLASKKDRDRIQVVPGGQSIGVQLHTKGVLVVGHHLVTGDEESLSPGEDASIQVGDMIIEMDGQTIEKMDDVKPIVEEAGKNNQTISVNIRRNNKEIQTELKPKMDDENKYQIGLYIRDSAAGIGTMSFYEPQSKKYGALGHVITDVDTQKPVETYEGSIIRSSITSIAKGNNGIPGEKKARFSVEEKQLGTVSKNSPYGIFGTLDEPIKNGIADEPMDIAYPDEVEKGPAKILTVLEDEEVEEFDIEIVSAVDQDKPDTKGMVIKITDEKLLDVTGGVVQGMSGSPIIQNDKIIGAVTHVFVNDPTSGYGVHIEWMLEDAEAFPLETQLKAS